MLRHSHQRDRDLDEISQRLRRLVGALSQLKEGLADLGVGADELKPGEFEIGFLIPRAAVSNKLRALGAEFVRLEESLDPFVERATGTRPDLQVRAISSSGFQVLLSSPGPWRCASRQPSRAWSTSTKRSSTSASCSGNCRSRKTSRSRSSSRSRSTWTQGRRRRSAWSLTSSSVEFGGSIDEGRQNELRTYLRRSLNSLANRIGRGYSVSVRAGLPAATPDDAPGEEPEGSDDDRQAILAAVLIASMQDSLRSVSPTGAPILELPEAATDIDAEGEDDEEPPDG
jgi:hypothetical protein